jgi:hypothetical protein
MPNTRPCCQHPETLTGVKSPFTKILALGFYDGPTSGVLQCATCSAVHKFEMLDWDDDHEIRIFRLAALPPDSLAQCVAALSRAETPRWPVWVPSPWRWLPEEKGPAEDQVVQQVLARAKPAELLIAWVGYGERVLAAKKLPPEKLSGVPDWFSLEDPTQVRDWFSLLGLNKRKTVTTKEE